MRKLRQGEHLEGRYVVQELIASGGQAHVYRGVHEVLDRDVAIKVLKNHGSAEVLDRMAKRFEQEAKLISKLRDPHTITLYDFGRLEDGALFMVFEYIDGISLKQLVTQQGGVEAYRVAKILKQTLSSLHEAHSMGVLHRDLKPANIMIYAHAGRQDLVKLLDFGIAKVLREQGPEALEALTGNNLVGTPRYIAPEVYKSSDNLGPQSDIYSLGLVAYELLVGEPAIKGDTAIAVFRQQFNTHSITLPSHLDLPEGLRHIIHTMLEREPEARYSSCAQVLWDLRSWQQSALVAGLREHIPGAGELDAFDPQDLFIPDPYDDLAPTQNMSGQMLADLNLDPAQFHDLDLNDTMKDASDSSEFLRRVSSSGIRHASRPATHTPSGGVKRSPVTLYSTPKVDEEFEQESPTQISRIISIPAHLFLEETNMSSSLTSLQPLPHHEEDCTREIHLTEELRQDSAHARTLKYELHADDEEPEEDDITESLKMLPPVARHPSRPRRTSHHTKNQDD